MSFYAIWMFSFSLDDPRIKTSYAERGTFMPREEISLQFRGFHPSQFTQAYLNQKLSELYEAAPYGAHMDATFFRKDRSLKGVLTIYSSAGKFLAVASGRRVKEVTKKLMEQIRKQLSKWKSERFSKKNFAVTQELGHGTNDVA